MVRLGTETATRKKCKGSSIAKCLVMTVSGNIVGNACVAGLLSLMSVQNKRASKTDTVTADELMLYNLDNEQMCGEICDTEYGDDDETVLDGVSDLPMISNIGE